MKNKSVRTTSSYLLQFSYHCYTIKYFYIDYKVNVYAKKYKKIYIDYKVDIYAKKYKKSIFLNLLMDLKI